MYELKQENGKWFAICRREGGRIELKVECKTKYDAMAFIKGWEKDDNSRTNTTIFGMD